MDGLQGAILGVKLPHLPEWTRRRREIARRYDQALRAAGFQVLEPTPGTEPVYHLYPLQVANRDEALARLKEAGVSAAIHYPIPLHMQPAFADLGYHQGQMPVAERLAARVLSLPICGQLTDEQADTVIAQLLEVAHV
jgi:dTDP-4-amino-4,6-dideoxygalactose transaminase